MGCIQAKESKVYHPGTKGTGSQSAKRESSRRQLQVEQESRGGGASYRDLVSIFGQDVLDVNKTKANASFVSSPNSVASSNATEHCDELETISTVTAPPTQTYVSLNVCYGVFSVQGNRDAMEDRHAIIHSTVKDKDVGLFGIYDGHGGTQVSEYLSQHLHTSIFKHLEHTSMDESIRSACTEVDNTIYEMELLSGSTAIMMVMRGTELAFASVGDSQVVLCTKGMAHDMCVTHKPSVGSERERILAANGTVIGGRIFGMLSVSRAFGDNDFKTSKGDFQKKFNGDLVSSTPSVITHRLKSEDEFVILACDGLFDVIGPQQAVNFVRQRLCEDGNLQQTAQSLVNYALKLGSQDNVSAIIVCFHQHHA